MRSRLFAWLTLFAACHPAGETGDSGPVADPEAVPYLLD